MFPALPYNLQGEAKELQPDETYWFQFEVNGVKSEIGRTSTTPVPSVPDSPVSVPALWNDEQCMGYLSIDWFAPTAAIFNWLILQ